MKRNYKINSVVFFPRNAEDTGIMPDDIITLTEADAQMFRRNEWSLLCLLR